MEMPEEQEIRPLPQPEIMPAYSKSYLSDLLLVLGLTICAMVVSSYLGQLYLDYYYGQKAAGSGIDYILEHSTDLNGLRIYQMVGTMLVFFIPACIYAWLSGRGIPGYLSLKKAPPLRDAWMMPGIVMSFFPILAVMYFFNQQLSLPPFLAEWEQWIKDMEEQSSRFVEALLYTDKIDTLVFNLVLVAVLPAICEEVFFRGTLMRIFHGMTRDIHLAILITAIVFSFFHFQFLGFAPRLGLGILFGYLFWWSGSIWTPIVAHLINNGWQVYAAYLYQTGESPVNVDEVDLLPLSTTAVALVMFLVLCYLYYKASCLSQQTPNEDAG